MLLLAPGSTIFVYVTFGALARGVYEATRVAEFVTPRAVADPPGLRGLLTVWWRTHTLLWRPKHRLRFLVGCLQLGGLILAAGGAGFLTAVACLVPEGVAANLAGRTVAAGGGLPPAVYVGAALAVYSLGHAFSYVAQPDLVRSTGSMPRISLPATDVAWPEAVRLARAVYLYRQLLFLPPVACFLACVGAFIGLVDIDSHALNRAAAAGDAQANGELDPALALLLLSFAISYYAVLPIMRKGVHLLLPLPRAVLALEASRVAPTGTANLKIYGGIMDQHGVRRETVVAAAAALLTAARRVDSRSPLHPMASIMRATALYLRRYVSTLASMTEIVPAHVDDLLRRTTYIIAGPRQPGLYGDVAQTVSAFDGSGAPNPELRLLPRSRWVLRATWAANLLEAQAKVLTALWGTFILTVAIYLIVTHRLDLTKLQLGA